MVRTFREALKNASRKRNNQVKINRLPPEVLLQIGSFLPYAALDAASQVCYYWHTTLVADPSLWTNISLSFERSSAAWVPATERALALCHRQPRALEFHFTSCCAAISTTCSLAPSVMHHLVNLNLWVNADMDTCWHAIVTSPAPVLETLLVASITGKASLRLPDNLFSGDAPSLRSIWLKNIFIPMDPGPVLSAVIELALFAMDNITGEELVLTFKSCPAIEWFTLVTETCDDYIPAGFVPPTLRVLRLSGWLPTGVLERVARANTSRSELRLRYSEMLALPLTGFRRLDKVHVFFETASPTSKVLVMAQGDDDYIKSIEQIPLLDVARLFVSADLSQIKELSLPDTIFAMLASGGPPELPSLEVLTILLSSSPLIPLPHLFTSTDADDTNLGGCPALHTVRLSTWHILPSARHSVELSSDTVKGWLPRRVTLLILSGVTMTCALPDELGVRFACAVADEAPCQSGGTERYLGWHPTWCPKFETEGALRI